MLVVEKNLDIIGGHQATQIDAIQSMIGNRPITIVTGHQCRSFKHGSSTVFPVLSSQMNIKTSPDASLSHDQKTMMDILLSEAAPKHKTVFYCTAHTHDIHVGLRLLKSISSWITLYMRILSENEIVKLSKEECNSLKNAIDKGRIVLLTETETLSSHLLTRYGLHFHDTALCLPCSFFPSKSMGASSLDSSVERPYRVGVLGGDRDEKGAKMLPQLVRQLRHALSGALNHQRVELVVQQGLRKRRISKRMKREYAFLRGIGWPMRNKRLLLSFQPVNLSSADFLETLLSMDLLLLPYRLDEYRHRGSGIVLDGVAARIPIVYTDGMGMTEFLKHGNAEAALEDPVDYASKVVRILADIEDYRKGAERAALEFEQRLERAAIFLRSI